MVVFLFLLMWTEISTPTNRTLYGVYFIDDSTGFTCGRNGTILKTTDGGNSWTQSTPVVYHLRDIQFVSSNTGFAVGDNAVFLKTTDGGNNWTIDYIGTNDLLALYFISPSTGFVGSETGVIWTTNDGGQTWTDIAYLGVNYAIKDIYHTSQQAGWALGTGVSGTQIWKTTNGWSSYNSQLSTSQRLQKFSFTSSNNAYACGTNGYVFKYNGSSWTNLNTGIPIHLYSIYFVHSDTGWTAGIGADPFYVTTDSGANFSLDPYSGSLGAQDTIFTIHFAGRLGWAVGTRGKVFKRTRLEILENTPRQEQSLKIVYKNRNVILINPTGKELKGFLYTPTGSKLQEIILSSNKNFIRLRLPGVYFLKVSEKTFKIILP